LQLLRLVEVGDVVTPARAPRIALYSPDSYGLGHFRRNRRLAEALVAAIPEASVLMLTGCLAADRFSALPRTDLVRLPSFTKGPGGSYVPRSLGVDAETLRRLRRSILESSIGAFEPDLLIVDHSPGGLAGEMLPVLERLHSGPRPALVALGLRDIIDDPRVVRAQWLRDGTYQLLEWAYDEVWVYGRRELYDLVAEYGVPSHVAHRFQFLGYIAEPAQSRPRRSPLRVPFVVASGGGGEDAFDLLSAVVAARDISPRRFRLAVFPGPLMAWRERQQLQTMAASVGRDVVVHGFTEQAPRIAARADAVVIMGGYNSMLETLGTGVPCLVVPRVLPRTEQLIRAKRMAARGWVAVQHPAQLSPGLLLERILGLLDGPPPERFPVDYQGGLSGVVERCRQALAAAPVEPLLAGGSAVGTWPGA
jgi:predicted glycosyltransferase